MSRCGRSRGGHVSVRKLSVTKTAGPLLSREDASFSTPLYQSPVVSWSDAAGSHRRSWILMARGNAIGVDCLNVQNNLPKIAALHGLPRGIRSNGRIKWRSECAHHGESSENP